MKRIERVINEMNKRQLPQLIVSDPAGISYLTGVKVAAGERLFVFIISHDGWHVLLANRMFEIPAVPFEVVRYADSDDQIKLLSEHLNTEKAVGIDKQWPARFLLPLMARNPGLKAVLASDCVDEVRAVKDENEISLMKEASRINDLVMERAKNQVRAGISELELARFIDREYLNMGCEGNSFPSIVSFGANAADPHHVPDDTLLKEGDAVLIDIGCVKNGYCSDMTRTYFCKYAGEHQRMVYDLVRSANECAESIVGPGVKFSDIDAAARNMIEQAGYGDFFTHRLGHFIGSEVHEQGDVSAANSSLSREGMIFSIEPGVYLPGQFGVRIEDLVLVSRDGCEVLNKVSKNLEILG